MGQVDGEAPIISSRRQFRGYTRGVTFQIREDMDTLMTIAGIMVFAGAIPSFLPFDLM